jgi:hypothetical protein
VKRALNERAELLENSARTLASQACTDHADWARRLGSVPTDPLRRATYLRCLDTVAAYRDLWNITTPDPLGPAAGRSTARASDRALAQHAAIAARRLASVSGDWSDPSVMTRPAQPNGPTL